MSCWGTCGRGAPVEGLHPAAIPKRLRDQKRVGDPAANGSELMKRLFLILVLAFTPTATFSMTVSQTLDAGVYSYSLSYKSVRSTAIAIGVSYRGITYLWDYGFTYGVDVGLGIMVFRFEPDFSWGSGLTFDLKLPIGYRWPGKNSPNGFISGVGPAFQTLLVPGLLLASVGIFAEFGLETNRTGPAGFHFVFQAAWSPLVGGLGYAVWYPPPGASSSGEKYVIQVSLRFGVAWRRARPSR